MQTTTDVDQALCSLVGLDTTGFLSQLLPKVADLVRSARRLPVGEEHAIRRGSSEFEAAVRDLGEGSLHAVQRALTFVDPKAAIKLQDLANYNNLVDSVDTVLERVDSSIRDALAGRATADEADAAAAVHQELRGEDRSNAGPAHTDSKPQFRWQRFIDNSRTEFVPRILIKHNQKTPLPATLLEAQRRAGLRPDEETSVPATTAVQPPPSPRMTALERHLSTIARAEHSDEAKLPHPYADEIAAVSWPDSTFKMRKPQRHRSMDDTPLIKIETAHELREMITEIKGTCVGKEIAVDVEHHDLRSYHGFVCLVQISTRSKDFLVDPFGIFEEMHWLNEIFTDPNIVKVLHGADRDVLWLQRDFSVFFVNMFDTGQATRALRLQGGFSLANLVSQTCKVKLDKQYQTADWRQRPLPTEMAKYARMDTHYLLYIYDCLQNSLLALKSSAVSSIVSSSEDLQVTDVGVQALTTVLQKSTELCLKQYTEEPFVAGNAAMHLTRRFKSRHPLDPAQFSALQSLLEWRDKHARRLDESCHYLAPDVGLWRVILAMPKTAAQLRRTCNPLPPMLSKHSSEIVDLLSKSTNKLMSPSISTRSAPTAPPAAELPVAATEPVVQRTLVAQASGEWPSRSCGAPSPLIRVDTRQEEGASVGPLLWCIFNHSCEENDVTEENDEAEENEAIAQEEEEAEEEAVEELDEAGIPDMEEFENPVVDASGDPGYTEVVDATRASHTVGEDTEIVDLEDGPDAHLPPSIRERFDLPRRKRKRRRKSEVQVPLEAQGDMAITDPYAPPSDARKLDEAEVFGKKRKKKLSAVEAQPLTLIDPYW